MDNAVTNPRGRGDKMDVVHQGKTHMLEKVNPGKSKP
jgi:hypothetical protein